MQSLASGTRITSTGQVEGEFVLGSSKWTRILLNNNEAFVHSALVSRIRPSTTARPTATTVSRSVGRAPNVNLNQTTTTNYVIASVRANARSCPRTSCDVITSFARGAAVNVLQRVTGESVSGNAFWQAVKHSSAVVYIHDSLLSRNQPPPAQPTPQQPASDARSAYPGLNCGQIRELNGDGNFTRDHPAYSNRRDGNNDGVACEL